MYSRGADSGGAGFGFVATLPHEMKASEEREKRKMRIIGRTCLIDFEVSKKLRAMVIARSWKKAIF